MASAFLFHFGSLNLACNRDNWQTTILCLIPIIQLPFLIPIQTIGDQAKKLKTTAAQLKEISGLYEEEQRARDEQHELVTKAERRANDLQLEIEELRANLEQVGSVRVKWSVASVHVGHKIYIFK